VEEGLDGPCLLAKPPCDEKELARWRRWLANAVDDPARGWAQPELETHLREECSTFNWPFEPDTG
jgi:hypothetical protein